MFYFAYLNVQDVVLMIITLPSQISDPRYIQIQSYDESLVGKWYNRQTGQFEDIMYYYVVMDMSNQFAEIISFCFPKARVVVDKFHVLRHVVWAMERVRKEVQSSLNKQNRRMFKRSR